MGGAAVAEVGPDNERARLQRDRLFRFEGGALGLFCRRGWILARGSVPFVIPAGLVLAVRACSILVVRTRQMDRRGGHDGRDRVLVDELGHAIAFQQHAEIVEPRHRALQLDAVDEEDGDRNLVLANVIKKIVL